MEENIEEIGDVNEEAWELTPKGFLFIELSPYISIDEFEVVWKKFKDFCDHKVQ